MSSLASALQALSVSVCKLLQTHTSTISTSQAAHSTALQQARSISTAGTRFYKNVDVQQTEDGQGYQIMLEKRAAKTPGRNPLVLPTLPLALAVAAEWDWQKTNKPLSITMPLTSLAATAIDQPRERDKVVTHCLKYIHTDAACCRYEKRELARRQAQVFDPLIRWATDTLGWRLLVTDSIFGVTQSDETTTLVQNWLQGLDRWQLTAVEQATSSSKSLVLATALLHGRIGVLEAAKAARLEEEYQMEDWGSVEAGHDLDDADMKTRMAAPAVFLQLLGSQLPTR